MSPLLADVHVGWQPFRVWRGARAGDGCGRLGHGLLPCADHPISVHGAAGGPDRLSPPVHGGVRADWVGGGVLRDARRLQRPPPEAAQGRGLLSSLTFVALVPSGCRTGRSSFVNYDLHTSAYHAGVLYGLFIFIYMYLFRAESGDGGIDVL